MGRRRKPLPPILRSEDVATGKQLDLVDDFTGERLVGQALAKPPMTPSEHVAARREHKRANVRAITGLLPWRRT